MVYLFLADGFETIEALTPIDMLRRADIPVTTVSVTGNIVVTSAHNVPVKADALFDEVSFSDAQMLVLPGGMPGTTNLAKSEPLMKLIGKAATQGLWIAAICAAPTILCGLGLLDGKKATVYPGFETAFPQVVFTGASVEQTGNIITGKGPGCSHLFAAHMISVLKNKQLSDSILSAMQF
ncbi:MAG: DJ-1/PfpI family protein [Bacteroidaceae bacterium]|nr:DJ-1/PfpI family protein [Bacteroidaceae bacterium]